MSVPLPPKKEVALALLERSSVHIHLDPRVNGVVVPAWFKKQPQLVLQVGLNMPVPIPDLRLDEEGMTCTLSFNRTPFFCVVPWKSVYAMVGDDGRGMVWPEDVPPEVQTQARGKEADAAGGPKRATPGAKPKKPTKRRGRGESTNGAETTGERPRGLMAVPSEGARKAAQPAAAPAPLTPPTPRTPAKTPAATPAPAAITPLAQPQPAQVDGTTAKPRAVPAEQRRPQKPKRELPPYLRVVK